MSLNKLVPEDHPKRIILDKLPWNELVKIARRAYQSDHWKDMPNARVMVGLYVWDCISKDKPYRDIEEDFSFNVICAYACGFKEVETRTIHHTALIKFEEHLGVENILEIKKIKKKQLQFLKRNLQQAKEIITASKKEIDKKEIQLKGKDRIVSFHRPNVRRGKAKKKQNSELRSAQPSLAKLSFLEKWITTTSTMVKDLQKPFWKLKTKVIQSKK
ncbi:MAG: hypothetical protein KAQ87_02415 [Candidatus Pacebacteria bacterium]|nr:hypothetical protein [Candidatus Paceibacterota bacterium]